MLLELFFCIVSNWGVLSLLGTNVFLMCCVLHPFPRILLESNLCACIKSYHGLGVAPVGKWPVRPFLYMSGEPAIESR
jgi:hypothetical protein